MKTLLINHRLILMPFLFVALLSCNKESDTNQVQASTKTQVSKNLPQLLDFGSKRCVACKKMEPILKDLANEYKDKLIVEFIDVWEKENYKKAKNYQINAIPTQIFYDPKQNELWRHEGFMSKDDIINKWKELGFNLKNIVPAK